MVATMDFSGRVALVTGGARGIGKAVAQAFLEAGAQVAICARNPPLGPLEAAGRNARFHPCDVRKPDQVAAMVADIVAEHGRLDVVINNAGGSPETPAADASPRFSESVVALNLLAPLHVSQAANRVMQGQAQGGAIVNIASVSGVRPSPGTAAYGAAKAGLLNLTQSLAMEWGPKVRVNAVVVGLVATEGAEDHYGGAEGLARIGAMLPAGRMGAPEDIAAACLYLASDQAAYVSGARLEVHGGGERPLFLSLAAG